jgi:hypothetical protein
MCNPLTGVDEWTAILRMDKTGTYIRWQGTTRIDIAQYPV